MPFIYRTVACANHLDIVPAIEQFWRDTGWTIVAGAGTQDVTARSTGEPPFNFTYLYAEVATDINNFYWRVHDTVHATTYYAMPKAVGAFTLHLSGDKNAVAIGFVSAALYPRAIYMGIVNSFNLSYPDETYIMVSGERRDNLNRFRVLRNYDGAWDVLCSHASQPAVAGAAAFPTIRDRFDNSVTVYGAWVYHAASSHIIGELYHTTFYLPNAVVNIGDTISTTSPGSADTTDWIVLSDNTVRYCMRTGGVAPTGFDIEPAPNLSYPIYARTNVEFVNAVRSVLASLGWTETDYSATSGITPDWIFHSTGESGAESIHCRLNWGPAAATVPFLYVVDWVAGAIAHQNGAGLATLENTDIPVKMGIVASKDCFIIWVENPDGNLLHNPVWAGKVRTFAPGLWTGNTAYSMACFLPSAGAAFNHYPLRDHDGTWVAVARTTTDIASWACATPQLLDGESIPIMPWVCRSAAGEIYGIMTYLYRANNIATPNGLTSGDEIRYGNKRYKYFRHENVQIIPYFVRIK